jgi:hypothetical protein
VTSTWPALLLAFISGSVACAQSAGTPKRCGEDPADTLLVFVGRRINVQPAGDETPPGQPFLLDSKWRASYQILRILCGTYPADRIEFDVYDHYGTPAFAEFETVLLYVSRYQGRLVHEKYMYNPVWETADGEWAGCGDPYALDDAHRGQIRAVPIRFKREVSFPLANLTEPQIQERYPSEYFVRQGNRAVCRAGTGVQDLFTIKRDGFLRARGIFQ